MLWPLINTDDFSVSRCVSSLTSLQLFVLRFISIVVCVPTTAASHFRVPKNQSKEHQQGQGHWAGCDARFCSNVYAFCIRRSPCTLGFNHFHPKLCCWCRTNVSFLLQEWYISMLELQCLHLQHHWLNAWKCALKHGKMIGWKDQAVTFMLLFMTVPPPSSPCSPLLVSHHPPQLTTRCRCHRKLLSEKVSVLHLATPKSHPYLLL